MKRSTMMKLLGSLAVGGLLIAAVATSAQPEVETIPLQFVSHLHAGMAEQDVFLPDADGQLMRVTGDWPLSSLSQPVFASAEFVEHDLFGTGEAPLGPFEKGQQLDVTLGQWLAAGGSGVYTRQGDRATLDIQVENLIPEGVYTVWCSRVSFPPNIEVIDKPCGAADGSQNTLIADENGAAHWTLEFPALPASSAETVTVVALAYHSDGQTYGEYPGDFGSRSHVQIFAPIAPTAQ